MKDLRIVAVGKLKTPFWREAAAHYQERLGHGGAVEVINVKDADPKLPIAKRQAWEGALLLEQAGVGRELICLDETGKTMTSAEFARLLQGLADRARPASFIIGGPYGLDAGLRSKADRLISLSAMTFTHEAALVFLLEQIYRARQIVAGTGYHH